MSKPQESFVSDRICTCSLCLTISSLPTVLEDCTNKEGNPTLMPSGSMTCVDLFVSAWFAIAAWGAPCIVPWGGGGGGGGGS